MIFLNDAIFANDVGGPVRRPRVFRRPAACHETIEKRLRLSDMQLQIIINDFHQWRCRGKELLFLFLMHIIIMYLPFM
jgi:hypothetical protein